MHGIIAMFKFTQPHDVPYLAFFPFVRCHHFLTDEEIDDKISLFYRCIMSILRVAAQVRNAHICMGDENNKTNRFQLPCIEHKSFEINRPTTK